MEKRLVIFGPFFGVSVILIRIWKDDGLLYPENLFYFVTAILAILEDFIPLCYTESLDCQLKAPNHHNQFGFF
jgi:hypothetical protein